MHEIVTLTEVTTLAKMAAERVFASARLGLPQDVHKQNFDIFLDGVKADCCVVEI